MEDKPSTNQELADMYFRVMNQYSGDIYGNYGRVKRRIEEAPVDVVAFYHAHGSLASLDASSKLGEKVRGVLERILEQGFAEVDRLTREKRFEQIRGQQWPTVSPRGRGVSDDVPPSWDDAVRRYEDR